MFTKHRHSLSFALLLALGAPQLAACDTGSASASAPERAELDCPPVEVHAEAPSAPAVAIAPTPEPAQAPVGLPAPDTAAETDHVNTTAVHGLSVRRFIVAHGVTDREPIGVDSPFVANQDRVYAFVDARNRGGDDREVRVVFERPDGRRVGHVALEVPANRGRWRTWGYTRNATMSGTWHALVVADDGTELARRAFEVR